MFGTFRKHSKWLWGIIIAAMAVSLVYWTGNRSNPDGTRNPNDFGTIAGKRITHDDYAHAMNEARLEHFFTRQEWPNADSEKQGFNLTMETYRRLFYNQKIKEMGIHISDDEVSKVAAQNLKAIAGKSQTANPTMDMFEDQILKKGGVTLADYERFLRNMIGRQQLVAAVTTGGQLVTTKDARAIYERENQETSAQAVFFSASNYLASITATPEALSEFYSNRIAQYRLPERVQVSYVEFKSTNFWADATAEMAKMTNLTAIIENVYQRRGGTNYYPELTPEKAAEAIRGEMHQELALRSARTSAAKFAAPLLNEAGVKATALDDLAKKEGLQIKLSSAFDAQSGPAELNVNDAFVRAAFELRDDEPIIGPLVAREAVYVIARNKQFPSENPPFELVREKVTSDYKISQAAMAARTAALALVQSATNMAQGKAFATLCAEAKAKPVLLPAFSMSAKSIPEVEAHMSLRDFLGTVSRTHVGKVNGMPTYTGAGVVYVMSKLPMDEKKTAEALPDFTSMLRQARQEEAFRKWFESEAPKVLADTPVVKRQPQLDTPGAN